MCVTMEDSKQADHGHGDGDRGLDAKGDDRAEHDYRERDAHLDERSRHTQDAEKASDRHDADEGQWYEPQRAFAELISEDADQDHEKLVIKTAKRVRTPCMNPLVLPTPT